MPDINQLIVVEQLPVIAERLRGLSEEIDIRIAEAEALECTEETVKQVKALRAELNKDFAEIEARRLVVKRAVLAPYDEFEASYKQYITSKYADADAKLKARIAAVEDAIKQEKADKVIAYLREYAESQNVSFAADRGIASLKVTLGASLKSLKEQAKAFVDGVAADIAMIDIQERRDEIMAEYMQCYDAARAVTTVASRHKAIAEQRARQEAAEAARRAREEAAAKVRQVAAQAAQGAIAEPAPEAPKPLEPIVEADPPRWYEFGAMMTRAQARELKQFFAERGIEYGNASRATA